MNPRGSTAEDVPPTRRTIAASKKNLRHLPSSRFGTLRGFALGSPTEAAARPLNIEAPSTPRHGGGVKIGKDGSMYVDGSVPPEMRAMIESIRAQAAADAAPR